MPHVLVVSNPVSGSAWLRPSESTVRRILTHLGADISWIETQPTVTDTFRHTVTEPFDRIIVIGGDGTLREVAQILLDAGKRTPLAVLARGSANIVASVLGIPLFPLPRALEFALHGRSETIDVLRINGRHICLTGAGQGYDTLFITATPRALKRRIGVLAYAWSFVRTFLPYRAQRFTIVVDGRRHQVLAKIVVALNAFGIAGMPIERSISAHDGQIDVFVLNPRTVWEILWTILGFLTRRPRERIPRLVTFRGKHVSIRQRKGRRVQIDGEVYPDKHLDIEVLPRALTLVHERPFDEA